MKAELPPNLAPGIKLLAGAVAATQNAKDALVSLLPVGLGAKGGEFNKVYMDTFQRIVLRNEPVKDVLEDQAKVLDALMKETGAPCWAPDKPSQGACPVSNRHVEPGGTRLAGPPPRERSGFMPARTSWIPYALIAPSVVFLARCSSCRWCRRSGCRSRRATACRSTTTGAWRAT